MNVLLPLRLVQKIIIRQDGIIFSFQWSVHINGVLFESQPYPFYQPLVKLFTVIQLQQQEQQLPRMGVVFDWSETGEHSPMFLKGRECDDCQRKTVTTLFHKNHMYSQSNHHDRDGVVQ